MQNLAYLVVLVTAICVAVDASRLGAKRGALGGGMLDMGPAGWFFACLLLWIVALPCYLAARPRLVRRAHVLATHPHFAGAYGPGVPQQMQLAGYPHPPVVSPQPAPPPAGPPPGYYPDPDPNSDGRFLRWWDGTNWAPRAG